MSTNAENTSTPLQRNVSLKSAATSPSSTTMSDSGVSTGFRQSDAVRTQTGFLAGTRKIAIRSDPSLLTCFDAADKQLYDLWVPKA